MQINSPEQDAQPMRPGEAARALGVSPKTMARLAERGMVRAVNLPSGQRRYDRADVERIKNGQ